MRLDLRFSAQNEEVGWKETFNVSHFPQPPSISTIDGTDVMIRHTSHFAERGMIAILCHSPIKGHIYVLH